ncbi:uncharacterized protein LOC128390185 [Panonychus citri]|uniref:uncharacterized protein LOC128390185 n=1 Tax=Panonychus citri TaxID=50023 RepID=UPI00230794B0|nr:uncharacterized protein LOC128390185 [Panonychus citri]
MIGGAFALKRKRKRESLLLAGNKTNQDQNVNNFHPGILSFGSAISEQQNQQQSGIIYYDNRGVDSAKYREMKKLNQQSTGLTVIAIFIIGIGLIILLISAILSGSVTTPITTLGLIFTSIGLLIVTIKCLTSYFIDKSNRFFHQHDNLIKSTEESTICKSTSSPSWINLPNPVNLQFNSADIGQSDEKLNKPVTTIILDPSRLSSKSIDQLNYINSQSNQSNYNEQKPLLINQQLITSLASSVDSNYDDQNNHDQ